MKIGPISIHRNTKAITGASEIVAPEDYTELGGTGLTNYGGLILSDYNPDMSGQRAIQNYDKMRRSDAKVRATLRIVKAPLLAAQWYLEPASNDPVDVYIADAVWWALHNTSRTFTQILSEALNMMDFGYYIYEKVFEPTTYEGKPFIKWKKFGPRHPKTIIGWGLDPNGGLNYVRHNRSSTGYDVVPIPVGKTLIFTLDEESGNPEGISLLRSAYKHWYYKDNLYKVDAIQKERHGLGIPYVELPPNYTQSDKELAVEMTQNLRTNEKASVVYPPQFKVGFLELKGQPVDALASAEHHDREISFNVLAQFLDVGSHASGSRTTSDAHAYLFTQSIRYISDIVRGVFNTWAIPELVKYNFQTDKFPELKVRRIGDAADFRAWSVALRNLKESGILTPDADFEAWWRDYMDLPIMSKEAEARNMDSRLATKVNSQQNVTNARVEKPTDGGAQPPVG